MLFRKQIGHILCKLPSPLGEGFLYDKVKDCLIEISKKGEII